MIETRSGFAQQSPALRRATGFDTTGCFVAREVLEEEHVAELRRILTGERAAGFGFSRTRGLVALARSDKSVESARLLGRILGDRQAPQRERAVAAASLGLLPPAAAEKPLLAALRSAGGVLRLEIIKSLGQVGTARAAAVLSKIRLDEDDPAARPLALAQLLIAIRDGTGLVGPDALENKLGLSWTTVHARRIDRRATRATLEALGGPTYGVSLRADFALRFDCGRLPNVLLLNDALRPGSFVRSATERDMIAGLVVSQAERRLDYFTVRWLLLTSPGNGAVRMAMVRPNGDPAFEGTAIFDGSGLRFTMRDTGIVRRPTEISGNVTDGDISWAIRVWRGALREKRKPQPLSGGAAPASEHGSDRPGMLGG